MVSQSTYVYLLVGEDPFSKDLKLKSIKEEFLAKESAEFNCDVLYAQDLDLKALQEKFLYLGLKNKRRMVVIKRVENLKENCKEWLCGYLKKPYPNLVLVLDVDRYSPKDDFFSKLIRYSREVIHFKKSFLTDTFTLSHFIEEKKTAVALRTLHQLLAGGKKPQMIIGSLRYAWEKDASISSWEMKRRLALLLHCDLEIKTGRLKPDYFALEKMIVNLCALGKPVR